MDWQEEKEQLGKQIVQGLYDERMILTWYRDNADGYKLASGVWSPYYINLRLLPSSPNLYRLVGDAMGLLMKSIGYEPDSKCKVVGIAMAGIPIADALSLLHKIPALYTRKLPMGVNTPEDLTRYVKAYGQHVLVEGVFSNGDKLAVVDDLVTTFHSKLLAINQIKEEAKNRHISEITLQDAAVLLDREQGGAEAARDLGYNLYALIPFLSKGLGWLREGGKFTQLECEVIADYVKNPQKYCELKLQKRLKKLAKQK